MQIFEQTDGMGATTTTAAAKTVTSAAPSVENLLTGTTGKIVAVGGLLLTLMLVLRVIGASTAKRHDRAEQTATIAWVGGLIIFLAAAVLIAGSLFEFGPKVFGGGP